MSLPKASIDLSTGNLGLVGTNTDGIAALVLIAATAGLNNINTPVQLTKLADAQTRFSIIPPSNTPTKPLANATVNSFLYTQISEFYAEAGDGSPLWTIIVPDTNTMTGVLDPTNATGAARLVMDAAGGAVKLSYKCRRCSIITSTVTPGLHPLEGWLKEEGMLPWMGLRI